MNSPIRRKTQKQMCLLDSGSDICVPQRDMNMASPYKALQVWVKRFSEYLAYEYCTDLILGKTFCISIFFNFPDNFLYWLVCIFIFDDMTVKTQNTYLGWPKWVKFDGWFTCRTWFTFMTYNGLQCLLVKGKLYTVIYALDSAHEKFTIWPFETKSSTVKIPLWPTRT